MIGNIDETNKDANRSDCDYDKDDDDVIQLIQKSNEEREQIFRLYDDSNKLQTSILSDDNQSNNFIVDTFGFMHNNSTSTSNGQLVNLSHSRYDTTVRNEELTDKSLKKLHNRENKWCVMLSKWQKVSEKLVRKRVYKGIPTSVRTAVWKLLLGVDEVKTNNPNVYHKMLRMAQKYSNDAKQIDLDVNRQFRDNINYMERYSIKQKSLFHVLVAYAMYNSEVGYCQGMSCIVAILLIYLPIEEDVFWALSILFSDRKFGLHGFFVEGFPKLIRFLNHQDIILRHFMPKLKKHFDKHNLDPLIYALKWYLVCFAERVPFSLCLRIWDIFLLEGDKVLTAMAFTTLKLHSKAIINLKDMDHILDYIQCKIARDFGFPDDKVISTLKKTMEELADKKLYVPTLQEFENELPKKPFGIVDESSLREKMILKSYHFNKNSHKVAKDSAKNLSTNNSNHVERNVNEQSDTEPDYVQDAGIPSNTESSLASTMTSTPILSKHSVSKDNHSLVNVSGHQSRTNSGSKRNTNGLSSTGINAEPITIPMTDQVHYVLRIEVNQPSKTTSDGKSHESVLQNQLNNHSELPTED